MNVSFYLCFQLDAWPSDFLERVEYNVYDITYPAKENVHWWKVLFKPCASLRLFFPVSADFIVLNCVCFCSFIYNFIVPVGMFFTWKILIAFPRGRPATTEPCYPTLRCMLFVCLLVCLVCVCVCVCVYVCVCVCVCFQNPRKSDIDYRTFNACV